MLPVEKPLSEIASEHEISPNQLCNWKNEFVGNVAKVFSEGREAKEAKPRKKK